METGKRKRIALNNPNAVNCCRDGVLFIFYPRMINRKVMVRGFFNLDELASYIHHHVAGPQRGLKPVLYYSLHEMIKYISRDYRHTEAITFTKVNNDFLADIRMNFRSRLHFEALRLGWIVDGNNKPDESLTDESDRQKHKRHQKIP